MSSKRATVLICVFCGNYRGAWKKHGRYAWVYAYWGIKPTSTRWIADTYRQRFGIETSYRQKNQAQAHTTSRDPVYRLLLEGIGYILRQVWAVLTEELARRRHAAAGDWMGDLTLQKMVDWLKHELTALHPEDLSIPMD